MKIGSLFAGIGGFDLAAREVGWRTAWVSEINPYASAVLARHFPNAPNHGDITGIKGSEVERVDILCGGFPCQDISVAGLGAGLAGARSGLWFEYARLIEEIRPRWVVAENVAVLRSRGLDRVLGSLAALGYDAEWHCIPAAYVGAPHRRDRVWIVAYPHDNAWPGRGQAGALLPRWFSAPTECEDVRREGESRTHHTGPRSALVADANGEQFQQLHGRSSAEGSGPVASAGALDADVASGSGSGPRLAHVADADSAGCREQRRGIATSAQLAAAECGGWWSVEPDVGRVAHGIPSRVDRLRCLGNAIVPQVALKIFQAIAGEEQQQLAYIAS